MSEVMTSQEYVKKRNWKKVKEKKKKKMTKKKRKMLTFVWSLEAGEDNCQQIIVNIFIIWTQPFQLCKKEGPVTPDWN